MRSSKLALGAALAVFIGAGAAFAAGPWPADPTPPPAGASPEVVRAWITANIDEAGYVETAVDYSKVVLLFDPSSTHVLPDGHVTGVFRSELLAPLAKDGNIIRSARKTFEIDCGAATYREVKVEVFAGSNHQRPIPGIEPAGWSKPLPTDSNGGKAIRMACDRAGVPHA